MIDINILRENPEIILNSLDQRQDKIDLEQIINLDNQKRKLIQQSDDLKNQKNIVSKKLGQADKKPISLIEEMREAGNQIKNLDLKLEKISTKLNYLLSTIPNLVSNNVPYGKNEDENEVIKSVGEIKNFDFAPKPHWELGSELNIIDFERGVSVSGSRFFILKGKGAKLQRALINWMSDFHQKEFDCEELYLPNLVNEKTVFGSGQLPKFGENMYVDSDEKLWLVPTAEVPITGMHQNEVFNIENLPINYVAHTPCYRKEKASAGKDKRGMKRVHQFEKIEIYKFVEPKKSENELIKLINQVTEICVQLKIPYRLKQLCSGDLGFSATETYDIEMWSPGSNEWLEVSSCSNCGDFQARRSNIKFRESPKTKPKFVHTLNGSGLALPRTIISIIENYQQKDGSIAIPEILIPYTGFEEIR
ncbi:MAG: serine--tRNA ligase [Chloroflexi bacterium]|nr:serine--tRNA ligase [Chloroflexota bacterium]|tara:strand:- start:19006 stop:20265 length:1260 start_codon:yes stop_codon:yes gene_type:complete